MSQKISVSFSYKNIDRELQLDEMTMVNNIGEAGRFIKLQCASFILKLSEELTQERMRSFPYIGYHSDGKYFHSPKESLPIRNFMAQYYSGKSKKEQIAFCLSMLPDMKPSDAIMLGYKRRMFFYVKRNQK